jgi:mRNA interferase RelE/StbE
LIRRLKKLNVAVNELFYFYLSFRAETIGSNSLYYERIRDAIFQLDKSPRPSGCKKLTGRPAWRLRVEDYRVIYEIHDKKRVIAIGHRKNVY